MKSAVIRFPGSNCERDSYTVLEKQGMNPEYVWHGDGALPEDIDLVVVPGGFSYGDYLRVGAMAAHSPIMGDVKRFAERGGHVLGICNGFQILCEAKMLPGTLRQNNHLKFNCETRPVKVETNATAFTEDYVSGDVLQLPIAHHEGCYYADADTLADLQANGQILFRYSDVEGDSSRHDSNPNGSAAHIAGIINAQGNVLGLMPHPERASEALLGSADGLGVFTSLKARLV